MAAAFTMARREASRVDRAQLRQFEAASQTLEAREAALKAERTAMADTLAELTRERDELRGAVDRFLRSKSWRYLAPARSIGKAMRRWLGNAR